MKPTIRCSQLPQLLNCSGSRTLMALVPRLDSFAGHEGSMLHWMVASRLCREQGAKPSFPMGETPYEGEATLLPPDVPKGYQVPKMSEWIVDWALRVVADNVPIDYALLVEGEFIYEFDEFFLSGHKDVYGINPAATAYIGMDWKTGRKPVPPADKNEQILGYFGLARRAYPKLDLAKFMIGQPLNVEEDGFERLSSVELGGSDLDLVVESLEERITAALHDPMTVESGMLQCAWCPVTYRCPAIQAEINLMKATLTPQLLDAIKAGTADAQLGDIVISARTISKAIDDAEETIKGRLKEPGSAILAGSGTRITAKEEGGQYKIINPEGAFAAVKSLVPEARLPQVVKYSNDRLIDEIATAAGVPKGGKAATTGKTIFEAMVRPNMEQGKRIKLIFS